MSITINPGALVLAIAVVALVAFALRQLERDDGPRRKRMSRDERAHIWIKAHKKCQYCGKPIRTLSAAHIDHIIPLAHGGNNDADNLALACATCNLKKGARTPKEAHMRSPNGGNRSWVGLLIFAGCAWYVWTQVLHQAFPHF